MKQKIKAIDVKITDDIKLALDRFQNDDLHKIFSFKAIEKAIVKFATDFDEEDYDDQFDVVWALTILKEDLRVLCFPDGGDEFDAWRKAAGQY